MQAFPQNISVIRTLMPLFTLTPLGTDGALKRLVMLLPVGGGQLRSRDIT